MTTTEEIRLRSYLIWLREGRPSGCEVEHWQRAKAQYEATCEAEHQKYLFQ